MENRESCLVSYFYLSLQGERDINNLTTTPLQNLFIHFSKIMFTSIPADRTSTAVEAINVNPFTKVVNLRFTNGFEYKYSNVSRAKIVNLMLNPNMSYGFWVQELKEQAVRALSYLKGNTVATGKLCYEQTGIGYATDALPFQVVLASGFLLAVQLRKDAVTYLLRKLCILSIFVHTL